MNKASSTHRSRSAASSRVADQPKTRQLPVGLPAGMRAALDVIRNADLKRQGYALPLAEYVRLALRAYIADRVNQNKPLRGEVEEVYHPTDS